MRPGAILHMAAFLGVALTAATPPRIALRDGWYHLDGRRTLVNALGYESGARPGQAPYLSQARNLAQVRADLRRIKAAGFNAIRTWSQMSEAELQVVQASGLKVVFGIWLKPDEDFGDPAVVAKDLALIRKVLAYTRNYPCVITYLIMNEPMPEHLRKVGAQATVDLWRQAEMLIRELHPGVPVTMSGNTAITEWVDLNLFDVYGRNAYDYGDGAHFTHGYAQAQRAITASFGQGKPSLLTEFGRSVSRNGSGGYGGNTLQTQADAVIKGYRDLLDAGFTGVCPFYYADGWWKTGDPHVHSDEPEAWFGFIGYSGLQDAVGTPRPVWHALVRYNQALLAEPRNQAYYQDTVPVNAFCQPAVRRLRAIFRDRVIWEGRPDRHGHVSGTLGFPREPLADRELVFEALDARGQVLKVETLVVLTGPTPISWPILDLETPVRDLQGIQEVPVTVRLRGLGPFTIASDLRLACSPHKGWDRPEARTLPLEAGQVDQTQQATFRLPADSPMTALYAGVDVRFGKFVRTLGARRFLYPGTWADPLRVKD